VRLKRLLADLLWKRTERLLFQMGLVPKHYRVAFEELTQKHEDLAQAHHRLFLHLEETLAVKELEYSRLLQGFQALEKEFATFRLLMDRSLRPALMATLPPTKLNLDEISGWFGAHRSGWTYAMSGFSAYQNNPEGVILEPFLEKRFCWHPDPKRLGQPYLRDWIGFLHCPPEEPEYFPRASPATLVALPSFQESLPYCRGLFVLSDYLRDYLMRAPIWPTPEPAFPISTLWFPTEPVSLHFSMERFRQNSRPQVLQIGAWLRNMASFYRVGCAEQLTKTFLVARLSYVEQALEQQRMQMGISEQELSTVQELEFQDNLQYDVLLSENLVFLDLIDASGNNLVIECIERNTPLIVRRLPAVVEYLGADYPGFFTDLDEAGELLSNPQLWEAMHLYLCQMDKSRFRLDTFVKAFFASEVYQSL